TQDDKTRAKFKEQRAKSFYLRPLRPKDHMTLSFRLKVLSSYRNLSSLCSRFSCTHSKKKRENFAKIDFFCTFASIGKK
ncbi:MAG: hypothetical protein J6R90_01825, partial [Alistipes sp.]|nr:hypothetical protein [Alistipes sp.]